MDIFPLTSGNYSPPTPLSVLSTLCYFKNFIFIGSSSTERKQKPKMYPYSNPNVQRSSPLFVCGPDKFFFQWGSPFLTMYTLCTRLSLSVMSGSSHLTIWLHRLQSTRPLLPFLWQKTCSSACFAVLSTTSSSARDRDRVLPGKYFPTRNHICSDLLQIQATIHPWTVIILKFRLK